MTTEFVVRTARLLLVNGDPRFEIRTALNGDEAPISRDRHPNIVALDVMLPGRDGCSARRLIKNDARCAGT